MLASCYFLNRLLYIYYLGFSKKFFPCWQSHWNELILVILFRRKCRMSVNSWAATRISKSSSGQNFGAYWSWRHNSCKERTLKDDCATETTERTRQDVLQGSIHGNTYKWKIPFWLLLYIAWILAVGSLIHFIFYKLVISCILQWYILPLKTWRFKVLFIDFSSMQFCSSHSQWIIVKCSFDLRHIARMGEHQHYINVLTCIVFT